MTGVKVIKICDEIVTVECLRKITAELHENLSKFEAARTDNPKSISDSAYQVISIWLKKQSSTKEAFDKMYTALCKAGYVDIATMICYLDTEEEN